MRRAVLSLLVENQFGVLSRITGLFSRRGFNIDTVSSGTTSDPRFSRITITVYGDDLIIRQIIKQVDKLVEVFEVKELQDEFSVTREIALIKVRFNESNREEILSIVNIFRAIVIDVAEDSYIIEVTGKSSKVNALFELFNKFEIIDSARTGVTALPRGTHC